MGLVNCTSSSSLPFFFFLPSSFFFFPNGMALFAALTTRALLGAQLWGWSPELGSAQLELLGPGFRCC